MDTRRRSAFSALKFKYLLQEISSMSNRLILKAVALSAAVGIIYSASAIAKPAAKPAPKRPAAAAKPAPAAANHAASDAALTAGFNAYLNTLRGKLDKNWYVADGKNHVTLTADVAADGTVTNLSITSSPSDTKAEQAASDAFNASQPLASLPGGVQSVKLTLTFDSTADPHGDSSRNIGSKVDSIVLPGSKPAASGGN
jgi:TonB family protein